MNCYQNSCWRTTRRETAPRRCSSASAPSSSRAPRRAAPRSSWSTPRARYYPRSALAFTLRRCASRSKGTRATAARAAVRRRRPRRRRRSTRRRRGKMAAAWMRRARRGSASRRPWASSRAAWTSPRSAYLARRARCTPSSARYRSSLWKLPRSREWRAPGACSRILRLTQVPAYLQTTRDRLARAECGPLAHNAALLKEMLLLLHVRAFVGLFC
jgi:hypothetical protein